MNINKIPKDEILIYISAIRNCEKLVSENKMPLEDAITSCFLKYQHLVSDPKNLKYELNNITVTINNVNTNIMVANKKVKDKKWFTNLLASKKINNGYWYRYELYSQKKDGWTFESIRDLDKSTNMVMNAIAAPSLKHKQDIRGLVFGYVQSGKTAHYLGLINKAADAGYKIIIVLAGIHNNLRSQTQIRIEEEFLGYNVDGCADSEQINNIGVANVLEPEFNPPIRFQTLTSRDQKGDFNKVKSGTSINPPFILVVKKIEPVLRTLVDYLKYLPIAKLNEQNQAVIPNDYPLLLIDDEADQASLNTNDCYYENGTIKPDYNPTKINSLVRSLLNIFECSSYVGYTATPFANIFIPPKNHDEKFSEDLFPRDFIVNMPKPDNYIGATEFFGLGEDDSYCNAMPLVRAITVGSEYLGKKNKKDDYVGEIPDELKQAVKSFLITVAIRNLRGDRNKPNTMLVHLVRYKNQQKHLTGEIYRFYIEEIYNYIKYGESEILLDFQNLWETDYQVTTETMRNDFPRFMKDIEDFSWSDIQEELVRIVKERELEILCINGDSKDALIYEAHKDEPFNVIVVGGDKLARGLTLEGLSVSYFTRDSKAYDTLMQMGRWFGYRPGYLDLCRLYTTRELHSDFVDISRASLDLSKQIHSMSLVSQTPREFGLGVETSPNLAITGKHILGQVRTMKRDYSNLSCQTTVIDINAEQFNENFNAVENFLNSLGNPATANENKLFEVDGRFVRRTADHFYWFDVNGEYVVEFLEKFKTSNSVTRSNSHYMAEYILNQMNCEQLTNWTICLLNIDAQGKAKFDIGPIKGLGAGISRFKYKYTEGETKCDLHTLISADHDFLDYDTKTLNRVLKLKEEQLSREQIRRKTRPPQYGLLVLHPIGNIGPLTQEKESKGAKTPFGFSIVFPDRNGKGNLKSYLVNEIALEMRNDDFNS